VEFRNEKRLLPELKVIPSRLFLIYADLYNHISTQFKKECITTCIFRSDEEQHELCEQLGIDYYPSPHSDYRAIDIVSPLTVAQYKEAEAYINKKYIYRLNDKHQVALYHKAGSGGLHIHLQVPPGTI
jgi:hypothetical protein